MNDDFERWYRKRRACEKMNDEEFIAYLNAPIKHAAANSIAFSQMQDAWNAAIESTKPGGFADSGDLAKELGASDKEAAQFKARIESLSGNKPHSIE